MKKYTRHPLNLKLTRPMELKELNVCHRYDFWDTKDFFISMIIVVVSSIQV